MPAPSALSPNVGNLQVGKGKVTFKIHGESTARDMGNATSMVVTPELETLDHFSSREGVKKKDLSIIIEKKSIVKLTLEEFTPANLALMLLGDVDLDAVDGAEVEIFSNSEVSGELKFEGTNDVGPKITVTLYNVSFKPDGDLEMISDEWNNMELSGDVLVANDGPNVGKFGIAKFTNLVSVVAPDLVSLAPTTGSTAGGTNVTLTGTGFTGVTGVTFGGAAATNVVVVSNTSITCTTPAHAAGAVAVVVTNPAGSDTLNAAFTYS